MLSGYMAFDTENDLEFTRKVTKNDWTMNLDRVQNFSISVIFENFKSRFSVTHGYTKT